MAMEQIPLGRPVLLILCVGGLLTLAGCGGDLKLVPVSGTVTLEDKPLTGLAVMFTPDGSNGNTYRIGCWSRINAQGQYQLATMGVKGSDPSGPGAPVGWYKVTLTDTLPGSAPMPKTVHPKYLDENKTPLAVEVVANPQPGAYDIKLTK